MSAPSVATRREAMEQIRYANRLIGGAIGTFQGLQRGNVLELAGGEFNKGDGFFGEHDRRDNMAAVQDVTEAEGAFRKALELLGRKPDDDPKSFAELGLVDGAVLRVFDIFQLMRARENASRARELHESFVAVFESLRNSDHDLAKEPPLASWDHDLADVAKVQLAYNPGVRFHVGSKIIGSVLGGIMFVVMLGRWACSGFEVPDFDEFTRDAPTREDSVEPPIELERDPTTSIPAALICDSHQEEAECASTCMRRPTCHRYAANLDGLHDEEWILVGFGPDAPEEATVEVFGFDDEEQPVRLGSPFPLGAEPLRGIRLLPQRAARGHQPICFKTFAGEGAAPKERCFEFDGAWSTLP